MDTVQPAPYQPSILCAWPDRGTFQRKVCLAGIPVSQNMRQIRVRPRQCLAHKESTHTFGITLHYRGPLAAKSRPVQKHDLRRHFHKQLMDLWKQTYGQGRGRAGEK